ncbi:MAG: M23 family metallopeptidase [Oscillospiraceae bacterium]|jgi:murein DD-endopeptidase MepM/ murein hydrolase activator NlpD|nr:M23 family metallopeptidase [Oscillospiraceae bacterium]
MKNNRNFSRKVGDFLAGKGFYIVLLACIVVIGASAWALFLTNDLGEGTKVVEPPAVVTPDAPAFNPAIPTPPPRPTHTPTPSPSPTPTPTPAPTPTPTPPPEDNHRDDAPAVASIGDLVFMKPLAGGELKPYSADALLYSATMGDWRTHLAIDYAATLGARVQCVADGTVLDVRHDDLLGTVVTIDHGFGLNSIYCNLATDPPVKAGDKVAIGAVIGSVSDTALAETGDAPHLHFEMKLNGKMVNPADYVGN